MPFQDKSILFETSDGRNGTVARSFSYVTERGEVITVPAGAATDGASIPREIWSVLPPFGLYWMAAVLHDWLYRHSTKPKLECDRIMFEAMLSCGVSRLEADLIFVGVRFGGAHAFTQDRLATYKRFAGQ